MLQNLFVVVPGVTLPVCCSVVSPEDAGLDGLREPLELEPEILEVFQQWGIESVAWDKIDYKASESVGLNVP